MSVTVKKLQLIPYGDKEEVNRVYEYIRNGIYGQYRILNTYMSQLGTLYYKYDRKIDDPNYKEEVKEIFRNKNAAIFDIEQAKGLGMAGNCNMRVKQDFSIALKNGLAKGERQLPYYKRDFPLLVPSRFLNIYTKEEEYKTDDGKEKTRLSYFFKFVNGIHFKVVMGKSATKDFYLSSLLDNLVNCPEYYSIGGSSIQFSGKKIILNLTVKVDKQIVPYIPTKNRTMALVLGYDQPLIAALSDKDGEFYIGKDIKDNIIQRRQAIQAFRQRTQGSLQVAKGGHGRKRKLRRIDQQGKYESNVMRNYNHILSSKVVDFAVKHKVECLVIDDLTKDDLKDKPVLLRNWSYFQLVQYIEYKAQSVGITVIKADPDKELLNKCCECGSEIGDLDVQWLDRQTYTDEVEFQCPCCSKDIKFRYNKAKNLTTLLGKSSKKKKKA